MNTNALVEDIVLKIKMHCRESLRTEKAICLDTFCVSLIPTNHNHFDTFYSWAVCCDDLAIACGSSITR